MAPALDRCDRPVAVWLGILTTCGTLVFAEGAITGSDGRTVYEVAKAVVEHGTIAIDSTLGIQGRSGLYYSRYGIGQSLLAVVPYLAARPIAHRLPAGDQVEQAAVASSMAVVFGLLVAALYILARRLKGRVLESALVAGGSVVGTFLLPYSKDFFGEPLTALCLVYSIERAEAGRPFAAGVGTAAAALTRPQAFLLAPLVIWRALVDSKAAGAWKASLPIVAGAAITLAYNAARFDDPTNFGYTGHGFSTGILQGATGLLLHPAKSVLLFAPVTLLLIPSLARLRREHPTAFWLIAWNLVATFVMAATWESWTGGWAWGPRLLLPGVTPALAAVSPWAGEGRFRKQVVVVCLLVGMAVSLPAVVVSTRAQQLDEPPPQAGPSIFRQYELVAPTVRYTGEHLYQYEKGMNRQYVTLWQVGALRILGRRAILPVVLGTLALLGIAWLSWLRLLAAVKACSGSDQAPSSGPVG